MNETIYRKIRRKTKEKIDNLEVWVEVWKRYIYEIDAKEWLIFVKSELEKWEWLNYDEVWDIVFEEFLNDYIDDMQDRWVLQDKAE